MKRAIFILLVLLFMWIHGMEYVYVYGDIPDREYEALRALYEATNGSHWFNSDNWFAGEASPVNTWHGITCNRENTAVISIELAHNQLKGKLPHGLSKLSNLESLVLNNNQLESLHEAMGNLSKLTILNLRNNRLTGTIPSWMGNLKNLTSLDLSNNRLTGNIPSWIGNLTNLKKLNLSNNRLSGSIPVWIGKLENLEELLLDGNSLSGPIPKELGNLPKLTVIRLGHNRLTGKIPSSLGKLTRLADNKSNFKWNALYTDNDSLRDFIGKKQYGRDWESTQTIAPGDITAVSTAKTSITVSWKPIAYTADSGGYRVLFSITPGGPYTLAPGPAIDDKTKDNKEVKQLKPSTRYYLVVRTWTDAHGSNRNTVTSEYSKEVIATTQGIAISGTVTTVDGKGVPGVKLTASKKGGKTFSDNQGNYKLGVTPGWDGAVTPFKNGYDFIPASWDYPGGVNSDRPNQDYKAAANTIISGRITDSKGNGIPGVTLTFFDEEKKGTVFAETDLTGNYSHTVTYNWKGTITPSKTGYKFNPQNKEYKKGILSREIQNFKSIPPEISGKIINKKGKGIKDVILTFLNEEGTVSEKTNTDEKGQYSLEVLNNWSGSVTPKNKRYIFYPAKRDYQNISIDKGKPEGDYKAVLDLKFFVSVTGNYRVPWGENFKDFYGSGIFAPEIKAGYKFYRGFYLWGGYGFFSRSGESNVFKEPTKWQQEFLSMGLGYYENLSIKFGWKAEVGVLYVWYTEEMSQIEEGEVVKTFSESGNAMGVRIGGAGIFKFSNRLYTEISLGYLFADDTINEIDIKLGGLRAGIGLGLRF
jgi:hypothetical protein